MKANIALTAIPHFKWVWSIRKEGHKLLPVGTSFCGKRVPFLILE